MKQPSGENQESLLYHLHDVTDVLLISFAVIEGTLLQQPIQSTQP